MGEKNQQHISVFHRRKSYKWGWVNNWFSILTCKSLLIIINSFCKQTWLNSFLLWFIYIFIITLFLFFLILASVAFNWKITYMIWRNIKNSVSFRRLLRNFSHQWTNTAVIAVHCVVFYYRVFGVLYKSTALKHVAMRIDMKIRYLI